MRQLPLERPLNKPKSQLHLMYFTGRAQVEMLHQSLISVEQEWSSLPKLFLVSDGTLTRAELQSLFSWWNNDLVVVVWSDMQRRAVDRGRNDLAELAEHNVLGRKLCAILESALEADTLFSDTDILWYAGPPPLPTTLATKIRMSRDIQAMYDFRTLAEIESHELDAEPWLNTGVCFVCGDVYAEAHLHDAVQAAARSPHYFSEQTILALACRRLDGDSWPLSTIFLGLQDQVRLPAASFVGQNWNARHYPGDVRYRFWVDAYYLHIARLQQGRIK